MAKEKTVDERGIVLYVILSLFIPFFALYWFYKVASDIKELKGGDDPKAVLHIILGIITCGIFFWYCYYQYSKYVVDVQKARAAKENDISVIALVVGIFVSFVALALIQNELNKFAAPK